MAIQPIDLQTLFTQVEKVGKDQANQKDGLQIQQALHNIHEQKKQEARIQSVNEAQDTGQGAERIKDKNAKGNTGPEEREKKEKGNPGEQVQEKINVIKDPDLGQNIDVSG